MGEGDENGGDALLADTLRLALVEGVGPKLRRLLLERFGTSTAVLAAAPSQLRGVAGVGPKIARRIVAACREIDVESILTLCRDRSVTIVTDTDPSYPRNLCDIHDPPPVLFLRGELLPADALSVAVVGTRHATPYGLAQAQRLGYSLAKAGLTVVSGLARGIDAAAHRGALSAGGRTLAVLGSGVLNIYPPEHRGLADEVMAHGALLSEQPPEAAPLGGTFPQRNRVISGMTLGVVVVEAAHRSGALITAEHAMEQNREVFAVPGRVDSRTSHGCHQLLRDGATLVESVDDVLAQLGPLVEAVPQPAGPAIHHPAELQLNDLEKEVLAAIGTEATSVDQILASSGLPVQRVAATLTVLEMRRLIRRLSGQTVARL